MLREKISWLTVMFEPETAKSFLCLKNKFFHSFSSPHSKLQTDLCVLKASKNKKQIHFYLQYLFRFKWFIFQELLSMRAFFVCKYIVEFCIYIYIYCICKYE